MAADTKRIAESVRRLRGEKDVSLEPIPGGANSIVYRCVLGSGGVFLIKQYLRREGDTWDRLKTEFSGLTFLWENGIRAVPRPVGADAGRSSIRGR